MIEVSFMKKEPKNMQFNVKKNLFFLIKNIEFSLPDTRRKKHSF